MTIETKVLKKWHRLKQSGDVSKIAELSGISRQTISKAINQGEGSLQTATAISEFYEKRKKDIKKIYI